MTDYWRKITITLDGRKTDFGRIPVSEHATIRSSNIWQVVVDTPSLLIAIQNNGRIWIYVKEDT